jgi:Holliday junction DNA helicase RuvA
MIGYLKGTLVFKIESNRIILNVNGVGYSVYITSNLASKTKGSTLELFTHTRVREDSISLFGFESPEELSGFELLISAHGIGPQLALSILSTFSLAQLYKIIENNDADMLTAVPGVGKKTAARIIMDLSTKLGQEFELPANGVLVADSKLTDIRQALSQLGYNSDEIKSVLSGLDLEQDVEVLIKKALKELAKI